MGHKIYMLVEGVEVPYEHHPQGVFLSIFMLFLMKHVARSKSQTILSK